MSRRTIKTEKFLVETGWDRPLSYFFLNIYNSNGDLLFSNLDLDRDEYGMSLIEIEERLEHFGVYPGVDFWEGLLEDRKLGRGNFEVEHLTNKPH